MVPIMRHLLKFRTGTLHFEQHFTMQSHTLNLEGCAETDFLIASYLSYPVVQIFHANQNVLKKCLKI